MMKKSLLFTALAVSASILLTGCSNSVQETKADGSPIVKVEGLIPLYSTPEVTSIPTWKVGKLPAGWTQEIMVGDESDPRYDAAKVAESLKFNPMLSYNKDKSCYMQPMTSFIPSNNSGRGDLYLSKKSFYDEADSGWYNIAKEKLVSIPTSSKGKLEMYSGVIDHPPGIFGNTGQPTDAKVWVAYRTIDKSFTNPFPPRGDQTLSLSQEQKDAGMTLVEGLNTPDRVNILPSYSVNIACKTNSDFEKLDIQALLDSLEINLQ